MNFLFGSSEEGVDPFPITGVILDDEGDVRLESDGRMEEGLSAAELAEAVSVYDGNKAIYFYDDDSEEYYGIYPDEIRTDEKGDVWIKVR